MAKRSSGSAGATWTDTQIKIAARLAEALAEPTRLRILTLVIEKGPITNLEVSQLMGLPTSTVSRHLTHLARWAYISGTRDAQRVLYEVAENAEILDELRRLVLRGRHLVVD